MKRAIKAGITVVALSTATVGALAAHAAKPQENDALVTSHATVSLVQAVQAAQQRLHGQAVRAELESSRKGWVYDVEVVANGTTYDVAVDAAKGKVLAFSIDKADRDDGNDRED
ncbi:PepSY domain-containing protein [Geobacter sp.]|uniref:PepSY domain-containing protein n=1 Tax=Geobacter sp. TaxID=46610 RepID=UPI0026117F15|nr:PepSY domain-containing protein [Geobacter sp.]